MGEGNKFLIVRHFGRLGHLFIAICGNGGLEYCVAVGKRQMGMGMEGLNMVLPSAMELAYGMSVRRSSAMGVHKLCMHDVVRIACENGTCATHVQVSWFVVGLGFLCPAVTYLLRSVFLWSRVLVLGWRLQWDMDGRSAATAESPIVGIGNA